MRRLRTTICPLVLMRGLLLAALVVEPTFAATTLSRPTLVVGACRRETDISVELENMPAPLRSFVRNVALPYGPAIQRLMQKHLPASAANTLNRLSDRVVAMAQLSASRKGASGGSSLPSSSFLQIGSELPVGECVKLAITATLCTVLSTLAMYKLFFSASYYRGLSDNTKEVTLEEFGPFAERVYERETADGGQPQTKWALKPHTDWSEEENSRYRDFAVFNEKPPPELKTKFELRRQQELKAYRQFLSCSLYVRKPRDKWMTVKVLLPVVLYFVLNVLSYVGAYRLGQVDT